MRRHLFIINLYANPSVFCRDVAEGDAVTIVSTHSLFDAEKQVWNDLLPSPPVFLRFDHWNELIESEQIDRLAFERNERLIPYTSIYQANYFASIAALKNAFVHRMLLDQGHCDPDSPIRVSCRHYELNNLGISRSYWEKQGALCIPSGPSLAWYKRLTALPPLRWTIYLAKALALSLIPRRALRVKDGSQRFLLLSTKRIRLRPELSTERIWTVPFWAQFGPSLLSAPIHSNQHLLAMYPFVRRDRMAVIQDAFRPTSYPPYYYANSYNGCTLVPQDRVDHRFFTDAGLKVLEPGTLLARKQMKMNVEEPAKRPKALCLSLNHAGNWSSLISRCDTDGPILALIPLVRKFPDIRFIIRLHPNSSRPMAEGVGWHERIHSQIEYLELPNLEVSKLAIEADWERSDLFVSEYSLSVVDALQFGKGVCFLNLTKRRSFVNDLVAVGFPEVQDIDALEDFIRHWMDRPSDARSELMDSINTYNRTYVDR